MRTSSSSRKAEANSAQGSATSVTQPQPPASGSAAETAIPTPTTKKTRDASVQVDDIEMRDAPPPPPKTTKPARRFAPMPIETTFTSNRTERNPHGPTAEPTPDPSPTTPQPPSILINSQEPWQQSQQPHNSKGPEEQDANAKSEKKPRRRFAPQLIETSRRARRTGQEGPATKPTDKTDITPGTNHIYTPRPKRKVLDAICSVGPRPSTSGAVVVAENEEDDDTLSESPRFLTPRRQQSMKPHPNTRRGTKSSFIPDLDTIMSSESSSSSEENDDEAPSEPLPMEVEKAPPTLPNSRTPDGDLWNGMRHELRERRESCDEEISGYLLAVAAKEAFRQRQIEQVMSAFPNGLSPVGVEHFVAHDNSEDEDFPASEPPSSAISQMVRRKSTDPGWAVREMRAHAEKLANLRAQNRPGADTDVDKLDLPPPHGTPLWTPEDARRGEAAASSPTLRKKTEPQNPPEASPLQQQPESELRQAASPFGLPSGFRGAAAAAAAVDEEDDDEAAQLRRMRQAASPPMLGKDLVFRRCVSPQLTRIEPSHPYSASRSEERDATGAGGLWGGYCAAKPAAAAPKKKKVSGLWGGFCTTKANEEVALMLHPSAFLSTPAEPVSYSETSTVTMLTPQPSASSSRQSTRQQPAVMGVGGNGSLAPPGSGLHVLSATLDERLRKEKARKELEERIEKEFDDAFVTQVYNYISLGYPATARAFDDELSKISGIEIEQLRKDDRLSVGKGFMLEMELAVKKRTGITSATGSRTSSGDDDDEVMLTPEEDERRHRNKPPRWRALKLYIREWARQHPSFDDGFGEDENPLAWGVRARRGSWAI